MMPKAKCIKFSHFRDGFRAVMMQKKKKKNMSIKYARNNLTARLILYSGRIDDSHRTIAQAL